MQRVQQAQAWMKATYKNIFSRCFSTFVVGHSMDSARAVGAGTALALSFLDRELSPYSPYCAERFGWWNLDPWSFLAGIFVGFLLFPLVELLLALRAYLLRVLLVRAGPASQARSLYRLL